MEIGFIRSSFCGLTSCAEIGFDPDGEFVAIRNSSVPEVIVELTPDEFKAFAQGIKAGEFDQFIVEQAV